MPGAGVIGGSMKNLTLILETFLDKTVNTLSIYLHLLFNQLNEKGFIYLVLDNNALTLMIFIFMKEK